MHSINNCNINNETARHKIEFPEKGGPKQQNGDGINQTDQQELGTKKHHHNRVYNQQESWSDQQRKRYRLQNYVGLYVRT